jgi:hypothetical protein
VVVLSLPGLATRTLTFRFVGAFWFAFAAALAEPEPEPFGEFPFVAGVAVEACAPASASFCCATAPPFPRCAT